jgi:exosortase family protein XrtF
MSSTVNLIKKYWAEFPPLLRRFCIKALLLILIWKLSYHLYIKPHRTIDKPLTAITTATTVGFLSLFYEDQELSWQDATDDSSAYIRLNGKRSLGIADGCNALELFILYAGFIICMPTNFKRAALFIIAGIIGIFILNILRCSGMFWFGLHKKEWFDFAHHYTFKIIVYAAIFGAWVWYCRKIRYND